MILHSFSTAQLIDPTTKGRVIPDFFDHDAASNLTSRTTPATQPISYTYDALNRLRTKVAE